MEEPFCLLLVLIVLALLFSPLDLFMPVDTPVDDADHTIEQIGDEAHRHMEQLTTQYREYLDEQTRRYR